MSSERIVGIFLLLAFLCVSSQPVYETVGYFSGESVNLLNKFIGSSTVIHEQQRPFVVVGGQFSNVSWRADKGNLQNEATSGLARYDVMANTWTALNGLGSENGVASPRQQVSQVLRDPFNEGSVLFGGWFAYAGNNVPRTMGAGRWNAKEGFTPLGEGLEILQNNVTCWGATDAPWLYRTFELSNGHILGTGRFALGKASAVGVWDGKSWSSIGRGMRSTCDVSAKHNFGEVNWVYDASLDDESGDMYFMGEFTYGTETDGSRVASVGLIKRNVKLNAWQPVANGIVNCANQLEPLDWLFRSSIARLNDSLIIGGPIRPFNAFTCDTKFRVYSLADGATEWKVAYDGILNRYANEIDNGNAIFLFMRHVKKYKNPKAALSFAQDVMTMLASTKPVMNRVTSVDFLYIAGNTEVWLGGFHTADDKMSVVVRCVDCITM